MPNTGYDTTVAVWVAGCSTSAAAIAVDNPGYDTTSTTPVGIGVLYTIVVDRCDLLLISTRLRGSLRFDFNSRLRYEAFEATRVTLLACGSKTHHLSNFGRPQLNQVAAG